MTIRTKFGRQTRGTLAALALGAAALLPTAAVAAAPGAAIDCPLRDAPYSVQSPLLDVLLNPRAKAVMDRETPDLLKGIPPEMLRATTPSFAAILTPKSVLDLKRVPAETVVRLDAALAAVALTDEDRTARCARYDNDRLQLARTPGKVRVLLFEKMTGFRDGPSVEAARAAFESMAKRNGWSLTVTDKGGAFTPETLRGFDTVIWNNVSGDVLTIAQRHAFESWMTKGGGFVGIHGSGGDPATFWDWYVDKLVGARFIGHPSTPQFQNAKLVVEAAPSAIGSDLAPGWEMTDEWYSFAASPRASGATVIARLDEASYTPGNSFGRDLKMGDHPIAWTRCVGNGRSFYSAIGHVPATYAEPHHVKLLEQAILWAAGKGKTQCRAGEEVPRAGRR
jgi:type 1 glutamine amidotransferase